MREIVIRNRQRACRVHVSSLRRYTELLLDEHLQITRYSLGIHLIGEREMSRINWDYLRHGGPTDIITFDHLAEGQEADLELHGELFICLPVAQAQAREFGTRWHEELARYVIHGVLHLRGYDDLEPGKRKQMKRVEGQLLRKSARQFALTQLARRASRS